MSLDTEYKLFGAQAEPTASFWLDQPRIAVPALEAVRAYAEANAGDRLSLGEGLFPDDASLEAEFAYLAKLEGKRQDEPYPTVAYDHAAPRGDFAGITELSRFLRLKDPPFGAIFDTREARQTRVDTVDDQHLRILTRYPVVTEGQELARMFEEETPGLYHRHALNWLLFLRPDIAPPRHARIWLALDLAIYTALGAAWYYKWRSDRRRLLRPSEYATRKKVAFEVHFDRFVDERGFDEDPGRERDCPRRPPGTDAFHPDSPGTPRHPAWPSGHSTYSAAATYVLEHFFSPDTLQVPDGELFARFPASGIRKELLNQPDWIAAELRRLANNIGEARLWAGVHWVSDHVAGQRIGRSAAQAVIDTFRADVVCPVMPGRCVDRQNDPTPTDADVEAQWTGCRSSPDPRQDAVPQPETPGRQGLLRSFGTF